MRLVRTILALVISASLAVLPLGASAAPFAASSGESHASMQMGAADGMSMDCCPDDMKGAPSHNHDHKCNMGLCCAGGAVALGDARIMSSEILSAAGSKIAIPADQVLSFRSGSPPFRPPRV